MKSPESPSPEPRPTRFWIVFLLLFCAVLGLLLWARGAVRETVVIPILYLFWLGRLVLGSFPQAVFWGLLVLIAAILLARGLRRRPASGPAEDRAGRRQVENRRVAHWAALVRRTASARSRDGYALTEFRKLIFAAWAYRANLSPADVERDLASGVLEPPPEFQFYLQDPARSDPPDRTLWRRALGRLRALLRKDTAPSPDPDLLSTLQALERMCE